MTDHLALDDLQHQVQSTARLWLRLALLAVTVAAISAALMAYFLTLHT